MNVEVNELDELLNYLETTSLEPHDNYTSGFTYKDQKILYKYIKDLRQDRKFIQDCGYANAYQLALAHYVAKKELDKYKSIVDELRTDSELFIHNLEYEEDDYIEGQVKTYRVVLNKIKELEEGNTNE